MGSPTSSITTSVTWRRWRRCSVTSPRRSPIRRPGQAPLPATSPVSAASTAMRGGTPTPLPASTRPSIRAGSDLADPAARRAQDVLARGACSDACAASAGPARRSRRGATSSLPGGPFAGIALVEVAKALEHRWADPVGALDAVERARALADRARSIGRPMPNLEADLACAAGDCLLPGSPGSAPSPPARRRPSRTPGRAPCRSAQCVPAGCCKRRLIERPVGDAGQPGALEDERGDRGGESEVEPRVGPAADEPRFDPRGEEPGQEHVAGAGRVDDPRPAGCPASGPSSAGRPWPTSIASPPRAPWVNASVAPGPHERGTGRRRGCRR